MANDIRVRFPPSPTGEPHVGNIRTAIFNWLFARGADGSFIIRIEDTDQSRKVKGAVAAILDTLRWLGIDWDEGPDVGGDYGPYVQSERLDLYRQAANDLLVSDHAYHCHCPPQRLSDLRRDQSKRKGRVGYDGHCRNLTSQERVALVRRGEQPVVRFKMPSEGTTTVTDLIRDEVTFENDLIDDFVILKSDGFPTYHLASVVDDSAMKITHVLRAEEWLPSTPRHVQLYRALGLEMPEFAHLPIILAPDRSKLSKRHGATSALEYREMGYLPEAMVNFLVLLGWSLDDKTEIFSTDELFGSFSLERVSRSGAVFSIDKLAWLNGHYIRMSSHEELTDALLEYWKRYPPAEIAKLPARDYLLKIVPLVQERLKTLSEASSVVHFFFDAEVEYDTGDLVQKGMDAESTRSAMEASIAALEGLATFDDESVEGALRSLAAELGLKVGQLLGSLRIATTGLRVSPPLFETIALLGRERSLAAIRAGANRL